MSAMDMLRAEAVGEWQVCGACFYSRELLCDMQWQGVDPQGHRLCCANFAGPFAMVRDERQMLVVTGPALQPVVRIFSAAGVSLGSFLWETSSKLLEWGWTSQLQLACIDTAGMVALRALSGDKIKEFSLGSSAALEGLATAAVSGSAVAALTRAMNVWMVDDVMAPRAVKLASPPLGSELAATCRMVVMPPHVTLSGSAEVLLVGGAGTVIYHVDADGCSEHPLNLHPPSPIVTMRLSPCGAFLALFTADGRLLVMSSDLGRRLSEFETHADAPPSAVEWCGSDAVVLQWPALLLVVGPYGDHASWPTPDETVVLASEVDGVRLIGATKHELLRKVPEPLAQVFRPGSTSPATQLWDARALLDAGNARADKLLRGLGNSLSDAVTTCVQAAGAELVSSRQKALLRAAAYGRAFCGTSFPSHALVTTAHTLRLLSAVREPRVGLPLTAAQLQVLGIPAVLARLVLYHHWLLAHRIAGSLTWAPKQLLAGSLTYQPSSLVVATSPSNVLPAPESQLAAPQLNMLPTNQLRSSTDRGSLELVSAASLQEAVLTAWACARITAASKAAGNISNTELKDQLMAKLKACAGIRYAPLAAHAQSVGRRQLALLLLEEETSCALQVPLLLSLAEGQASKQGPKAAGDVSSDVEADDALARALRRAIESGDTDLVMAVLFHSYRTRALADFWQLVCSRTLARNLFVKYCKSREPELLETLLTTAGQATELAELKKLNVARALAGMRSQMCTALYAWVEARASHAPAEPTLNNLAAGLTTAANKYSMSRDHVFQAKAATDLATLRRTQAKLESETGHQLLVGLSLQSTLQELIRLGHHKHAATLRKQFNVGDKQFWWLKIRCLAEARAWDALDVFAAEKKSPVGYEPFLEVARRFGAPQDVQARFISRLPDSAAKADAYASVGMAREAAEVAARIKDGDLLRRLSSAVSAASPAGLAIAQIKERFFAGAGGTRA